MPSLQPSGNFLTASETLEGLLSLPFALLEGELAVLGGCHAGDALECSDKVVHRGDHPHRRYH